MTAQHRSSEGIKKGRVSDVVSPKGEWKRSNSSISPSTA